ncbi:hypothetical protein LTR56_014379 [Elasticomyces elasticus]|nr:hypothetical protein LTR22_023895 [Elasticomyces elasticus]KAK3636003.1 hypothetical protein LTR56_014379 [Elasticomyces elasticus]KAK4916646.1 hypothetical protein LTR49_015344 [Elasticomyces elasticus]KAK5754920.1 hypothetical protein LTS12_014953 [Elasticomyces elasticus]
MTKLLVVVSATGRQGLAIIKYFQEHVPSYKLRGTTRNTNTEAAIALVKSGVEIVPADTNDFESLKAAFKGASAIFAYTTFSGIMLTPEIMGRVVSGELPPPVGQYAYDIEVQQGKNMADAAATVPELERLVWSSLSGVTKWSKGKYTQAFHFDTKEAVRVYMNSLEPLKGKVSCLQLGMFTENLITMPERFGLTRQADGSLRWAMQVSGDEPVPIIDIDRDTGAFVHALLAAPGGIQVTGASEFLPFKTYLQLLCDHLGTSGTFETIPFDGTVKDDPTGWKLELVQVYAFIKEFGYSGGDPEVLTADDLEKRGFAVPRSKVVDHIKRSDWSHLVAASA